MKAFSVCGISQSGKTTTVEKIIGELRRRGCRVGTVKEIHYQDFAMDQDGTNTWRHRMAGAEIVIARGFHETDIMIPRRLDVGQLLSFFDQDFVILEGVSDGGLPKIICAHQREDAVERMDQLVFAVSGRIAENLPVLNGIPVFNALNDIVELTDLIMSSVGEFSPDPAPGHPDQPLPGQAR